MNSPAASNGPASGNGWANLELIIFDLDGTLRHNDPPGLEIFYALAGEYGLRPDAATLRRAERWTHEYWANSANLRQDIEAAGDDRGYVWLQFTRRHVERLGAEPADAESLARQLNEAMRQRYKPVDKVPPDVIPSLERLRQQGLRLGLVSNRDRPLHDLVGDLGLADEFEFALAAGEVGYWKPDPRLLQHALDLAGVAPEAAMYIGDNYYADVGGARAAGVHPVLVDPKGLFEEADCPVIANIGQLPDLIRGA
jgi:putative hydrolase of the HAD superfamily